MSAPRKLGRFKATLPLIVENWPMLANALNVLVVDCRVRFPEVIEYTAYGEAFDEVAEGAVIPEYVPTFTVEPNGTVTLEWKRTDC